MGVAAVAMAGTALTAVQPAHAENLGILKVHQRRVNFGAILLDKDNGFRHRKGVTVENVGIEPLEVTVRNPGSTFKTLAQTFTLQGGQSREIGVRFEPQVATVQDDVLTIMSNDENHPLVDVRLFGIGVGEADVPLISGGHQLFSLWTTPEGDAFRLQQERDPDYDRHIIVKGTYLGDIEMIDGNPDPLLPFTFVAWFDGKRLVGEWSLQHPNIGHQTGLLTYRLDSNGTLYGGFALGDGESWDVPLTRSMTDFSGGWKATNGARFFFQQQSTAITGSFEGSGGLKGQISDSRRLSSLMLVWDGTFQVTVPGRTEPIPVPFKVSQSATGKLSCILSFPDASNYEFALDGPFPTRP
jgi:hypothetical protein